MYKNIDVAYLIYPRTAIVSMPNKFFESIVTETPIIADVNTEFGQIVKEKGFGFVVDSDFDMQSQLKDIFTKLVENNDVLNNFKFNMANVKNEYYWENNVEALLNIYR